MSKLPVLHRARMMAQAFRPVEITDIDAGYHAFIVRYSGDYITQSHTADEFVLESEIGLFAMKRDQVFRALEPFDQHLHGAVGQLQHLQDARDATDLVDVFGSRLILRGVLLCHEHDALTRLHRGFERPNRLRTTDE